MYSQFSLIKQIKSPRKKILFLGYNQKQTCLIDELISKECEVWHSNQKLKEIEDFDLIISFGYRHLINKNFLSKNKLPIINLHISYLPWNRGSHPNFWSFFDSTPSGVTIHLINHGIDTGDIIYQRFVHFNEKEDTFAKTHQRLIYELEKLFIDNIENIIMEKFVSKPQHHIGSYHKTSDLPKMFLGWDSKIKNEIQRLKNLKV